MSTFKPASPFQPATAVATDTPAPAVAQAAAAQPPAVIADSLATTAATQVTLSPADIVFERHHERLLQSGADITSLRQEVERQVAGFDATRPDAVHGLGARAGEKIVQFSDKLLGQVRTADVEGLGDKLHEVVLLAKEVNVGVLVKNSGTASKIPLIGGLIDSFRMGKEKLIGRYDTLSRQMEKLVADINVTQGRLATRIRDLETVYGLNVEEYRNLEAAALVGEVKLEELRQEVARRRALPGAADPVEAQALADLDAVINRLGKRVHDLQTMQMVAIQTAPMIRLVQSNNQTLIDKFRNLQELTIPSWKKQFTLAIALLEQKRAVELTQKIDDTTNELMRRNADLLRQNTLDTARANERSVVDIETLEHVQQSLIGTLEEVEQIRRDGEVSRQQAVQRMEAMKTELITTLNKAG